MNISDGGRRRFEDNEHTLRIYPGTISEGTIYCPIPARKNSTAAEVIDSLINRLHLDKTKCYVLAEVKEFGGEEWILNPTDCPVQRMMLWPRMALENRLSGEDYRFLLREKNLDGSIHYGSLQSWLRVTEERRRMMERGFLPQPQQKDFDDLCSLPDLNEKTLLENLRNRFKHEKIYTYVGSILIAINPFKFLPIYNPKYVKMYDNHQLGKLEPHIYAVADVAYHAMLQRKKNQCIVISGESGSGKTQSTNFLIHHLTALSQKGFASGVEQIILGAGPVLEAFGNAKTAHNNNSSRFGKFIQVNYQETGTVLGAYVEKYLLEKSRLVYQEHNERNYHVFYYLLAGASEEERLAFHLKQPEEYHYLNQDCFTVEGEDLRHDFERLQLAMEMVGFLPKTRRQIFSLLSAILHLGNICYKKKTYRDDSIDICNPEVLPVVSELLEVKEEMLFEALVTRKTVTVGEKLILPYKLAEAVTVRNSMAKSLYSALFDWIVFRINHALMNSKDLEQNTKTLSIGVLDIFGFEDYENNSFEQFCINFANERLQHYFNQHIFKLEQEEYRAEGISWHNIDYIDNTCCINLISKKPTGLLHLLDEESNFPQATNQTLLDKFKHQHEENSYIEFPAVMEPAFIIKHYAGKVKYGVKDFREKNTDHMRPDIVALLRSSKNAFISGMIGIDPVAVFRWAVLRAFFRAMVAFREAGKRHIQRKTGHDDTAPCAILKSMDSISFLQHPVHQRSLEILQRCKEEKYNITRKNPRTPLSDLQGMNTLNEKNQHETFDFAWNGRTGIRQSRLSNNTSLLDKDGIFANSASSKLLERAHGILTRNKNFKSKPGLPKINLREEFDFFPPAFQHLLEVKSLKHLTRLTLQDRITKSLLHLHKKKKPPSISAQFQASLSKLMETLGQAEPYFVKCIRSNAEKLPLRFSDALVLRQLRYTGMLETVRIRQSGYSCKYSFQDFVSHFHVLLPRNIIPSKFNIKDFFRKINLNPDNYQVGKSMVFLKERERQHLQDLLHQEVLRRIILLQQWFRVLLCRQHFLHLRQASITIQRFWRNYLNQKQVRDAAVQKDALVMASAATLLQASWRAHLERQRYLELRTAAVVIQQRWREHCRRRHMAAICIQARWKGYRESKRYQEQRNKIILLQSLCRGFKARQRFKALKEQRLKETKLELGLANIKPYGTLEIHGSDPSEWEDCSFDNRVKAIEECKSVIESNRISHESSVDRLNESPKKRQERARSHSGVDLQGDVIVRERPKSLEDLHQKKVGRAKRESRRMRELEQAIFSLELLKVRSLGGVSPSEERRWSTELMPEGFQSLQGTPDSESSQGSLELLSCEESQKSKLEPIILDEGDLPFLSPKISSSPSFDLQDNALSTSSETNYTLIQKGAPSDSVHLKNGAMKEKLVCRSESITCKPQLRDSFISNSLPTFFYIPQQDPLKTSSQLDTSVQRNKLLESEETLPSLTLDINREARKYHFPGENQVVASLNTDSSNTVLKKLEKLNTEKEERQKQLQQQNEKEMMEQIRQQTDILEKERKAFKTIEKPRTGETFLVSSFRQSKQRLERPSSLLILNTPDKDEPSAVGTPSVTVKDAALAPKDSHSTHLPLRDRPVTLFFERKGGPCQSSAVKELSKADRVSTQLNAACKLSNNRISKREHLRLAQPCSHKSDDPFRDGSTRAIFFTPKENMSSSLVTKEALNSGNPQLHKQDEPAWKSVKLTGPGQGEQVARPAHKKKARMARTRSDFLTRGTFADGEGDTEEDDYDDIIEPLLSLDQASHSELGPAPSLGQASHSDSEMTSQRFSSVDEEAKLHKTMSQGEITKLEVRQKASDSDIRPQRAKMRFWAKGKQGEKKTTRAKPAIHSEVSALFAGSDMIPAHQFPDELSQNQPTPPLSPELPGSCRKEFKENKEPSPKARRKRSVKISSVALESMHWQNDSVQIIASASDLKSMDEFLLKKMNDLDNEDSKKDTLVDVVFKKALKEFRQNIFSFYSSALAIDDGKSIRYKDLYALFEQILEKTMRLEQRDWSESPVRVWVNTFKVFLDEYMNEFKTLEYIPTKVPKTERKKRRKKETDLVEEHNGHIFKATQYSIPTYCEYCSSLIWIMDRASVCKLCKYACHKKCCLKTTAKCSKKYDPELSSRQFGVELSRLTSEDRTVPLVVEKLINYIEMHGLYTEGIYRKSGSTNKIKELRQGLDTDAENVNLDDYNIHVIASVFKQWLRDLPNPLMTFELYEEFLRAMGLQERKETIRGVYSVIDQLSRTHLNTLERLIFHLVRIALQEDTNRMSANALAIVFAPCILRCPDTIDPLQSVQDISKTTTCVELIVVEQMNKYKARLKDISSLEFAENKAKTRLSLIRRSMGKGRLRRGNYPCPSSPVVVRLPSISDVPEETLTTEAALETDITEQQQAAMQQEERVLTEQIENLQKEKEELTFEMLVLEPRASDEETLESEASIGTADSSENLNVESEGAISEKSERSLALISLKAAGKSEPSSKLRKQLRKQQDSLDSVDSSVSSLCSSSTASSHGTRRRFQIYSKSPFYRASSAGEALGVEGPLGQTKSLEDKPQFISRGTFNPEKGKQKLKNVKNSPQKTKETPEGTVVSGRKKTVDPDCSSTQQLALFGNNEFMV
ncbi:unconventional myosin-IXa isoform X4 [Hippopotamus amphibius kiboko]|uniref:unconventional myosin-IXa isoform X4 n=1 Tax=Hippopotamus amphibius kiboko TaxID=575201 RepID=UPI0025981826|nr:unconventional myosin-IXa isoform X4 [Hippopotamus amphibius kiboko]